MADAIINVNKSYNLESHDHNDNIPLSVKLYYNPENVDNYRRIEHYADRGRHEAHTTHGNKLHKGSRYALLGLSGEHGHGHHGEGDGDKDDDNDENSATTDTISTETNDPCEIFRNKGAHHCSKSGYCVENFDEYSYIFGMPICSQNIT